MSLIVFAIIAGAALFIAFVSFIRSPARLGSAGEARVRRRLSRLPNDQFIVLNDLLLPTKSGTRQIDHVVIAPCRLFVIETKNFSGWIHGQENSEYWTQTIYSDRSRFRNPIKQNWAHIYAMKEILKNEGAVHYHPIVVFAGNAELKNVTSRIPVIYVTQLLDTIANECMDTSLGRERMNRLARALTSRNLEGKEVRHEHKIQTRVRVAEKKQMERARVCPKCGGQLVPRRGPYGEFLGCSNYPRCRYTLNRGR
jgi:hypothetical protein